MGAGQMRQISQGLRERNFFEAQCDMLFRQLGVAHDDVWRDFSAAGILGKNPERLDRFTEFGIVDLKKTGIRAFLKNGAASRKSAGRSHGSQRSMPFPRVFASRLRGELLYFPRSYERGCEII